MATYRRHSCVYRDYLDQLTNEGSKPLQKHVFSDDDLYDGVRFYVGPWYAPGRSYAYQYQDGVMVLSDSSEDGYDVQAFDVNYCDGLSDAYDELIESIVETVDYATGGSPEPKTAPIALAREIELVRATVCGRRRRLGLLD